MSFCVVFSILFLSITSSRVFASDVVVSTVVDHQSVAVLKGRTLSFDAPSKISKTTTIKSNTYSYSSVTDSSSSYDVTFGGLLQAGYSTATTAQGTRSYGSSNVYVYINGHKYTYYYGTTYRVNGVVSSIYFESTCTAEYQGGYDYVLKKYGKYIGNEYIKSDNMTITINKVRSAEEQQLIDEIKNGNKLQEKGNELQQEGNTLQKEQNDISKGIFDKIADFFGSFFSNLMDSIKGLFIPEDGFFSDYFSRLNDFFNEKLGILYLPIEVFIRILTSVQNAERGAYTFEFPELSWDGTVIIPEQSLTISSILNGNKILVNISHYSRLVVDYILIISVLNLLYNKLKEILEK